MKRWILIISVMILSGTAAIGNALGQSKSLSTIWSLNGIGLGYEHYDKNGDFIQIDIKAETNDIFIKTRWIPEASASFTWNMTIAEHISRNGNSICVFAGPGALAGWVRDNNKRIGAVFGIKGRIGAECRFTERHITVSASLAPEIGMHISVKGETSYMRLYRYGLLHGIMPEIGIKYDF